MSAVLSAPRASAPAQRASEPARGGIHRLRAPRTARRAPARLIPGRRIPFALAVGPLLLLAGWSCSSAAGWIDPRVLPPPWTVLATALELCASGRLQGHLFTSLQRALFGLGAGLAAGTLLGLLAGLTRTGEAVLDGPVQMKRAVPTLALIPLLILWFGIGETMKVLTIALAASMPVYVNTHAALRAIDMRFVELAQTLELGRGQFLRAVALPGALPGFFLGLRLAVTAAWLSLVVVEQINATSGIGYMMSLARSYGQTEIILVGLVLYGVLGLASDTGVRSLERRALAWRRSLAN
jgi:sulfonate transport system permease protein